MAQGRPRREIVCWARTYTVGSGPLRVRLRVGLAVVLFIGDNPSQERSRLLVLARVGGGSLLRCRSRASRWARFLAFRAQAAAAVACFAAFALMAFTLRRAMCAFMA